MKADQLDESYFNILLAQGLKLMLAHSKLKSPRASYFLTLLGRWASQQNTDIQQHQTRLFRDAN